MKNITKNFVYIIVIGFINFGISTTRWIPNKFLEIILWGVFIGLTLLSIYFITKIIEKSYKILIQKYSPNMTYTFTSFISLALIGIFCFINFINFLFLVSLGTCVDEYVFDGKKFYVYDTSFMYSSTEISVKIDYLPIRREIVSSHTSAEDEFLYRDENMVYFFSGSKKHNLYDLNTSNIVDVKNLFDTRF